MRYYWNLRSRNTPASIDQPLRGEIDGDTLRLVLRRYLAGLPLLCDGDRFECWSENQVEVVEQQPLGMVFPPDYTPSQNAFYEIDNDAADGDLE